MGRVADVGKTLRVRVTASATGRTATATSTSKTVTRRTLKATTKLEVPGTD